MTYTCTRCDPPCELPDRDGLPPILCPYFAYKVPEWREKEAANE